MREKMNKKEKTIPMNISLTLKDFVIEGKAILKKRYGKFYSEPAVLMYYLKQGDEFMQDYSKYCRDNNKINKLMSEDLEKTNNILSYYGKDNLSLLTN